MWAPGGNLNCDVMSTAGAIALLPIFLMLVPCVDGRNFSGGSTKIWNLLATFNGRYDNVNRSKEGITQHTNINVYTRSVYVPALSEYPVMFLEPRETGHRIEFSHIIVPMDGPGDTIIIQLYNFTGNNISDPDKFDFTQLANYSKDDFSTFPDCRAALNQLDRTTFCGQWPVCTHKINGTYPFWGVTFTCNHIALTIPLFGDEARNALPYDMTRYGEKFPVVNVPKDFVDYCDPKNRCPL